MFMHKYRSEAESNDLLRERVDQLESRNYQMGLLVDSLTFDKEQLTKQVGNISTELTHYVNESKKMQNRADKLRRQREEFLQMNEEERLKMIFDVQDSKDRIDRLKMELYEEKRKVKELEVFRKLYENLKVKDQERENQEIQKKIEEEFKKIKERQSLIGHIKMQENKQSIFAKET